MSNEGKAIVTLSIVLFCALIAIIFLSVTVAMHKRDMNAQYRIERRLRETLDAAIRMLKRDTIKVDESTVIGTDWDAQKYVYQDYGWHLIYEIDGKYMEKL